jgi:hypothetical protein
MAPGTWGLLLVIGVALWAGAARARPLEQELPLKRAACFERAYDAAHLKARPRQQVTRIRLLHLPDQWTALEDGRFYVSLVANLRSRRGDDGFDYRLGGFCRAEGASLVCTPEWEAGRWRIERGPGNSLDIVNGNVVLNPYNHDAEEIAPGAVRVRAAPDDRRWRLVRVSDQASCKL